MFGLPIDPEEEREREERSRGILEGFMTPRPTRVPVKPDSPEMGNVVALMLKGISDSAVKNSIDPMEAVEARLKEVNPARVFLHDFLAGMGSTLMGTEFKNARTILTEREVMKQQLNQGRDQNMISALNNMFGFVESINATEGRDFATAAGAAEQHFGDATLWRESNMKVAETSQVEAIKTEEQLIKDKNKADVDIYKEMAIKQVMPTELDKKISFLGAQLADTNLDEETRVKAQADFEAARAIQKKILLEDENLKASITKATQVREPHRMVVEVDGPLGTTRQLQAFNPLNGELIYTSEVPNSFKLADNFKEELNNSNRRVETLREISGLSGMVDSKQLTQIKNDMRELTSAGQWTLKEVLSWQQKKDYAPNSVEARLFQLMGRLLAETVVEFTGAQATDNERKFIQGTLPGLMGNANTFESGIELLRIQSEWSSYRLRNQKMEAPDQPGGMAKLYDVSGALTEITRLVKTGKLTAEQMRTMTPQELEDMEREIRSRRR